MSWLPATQCMGMSSSRPSVTRMSSSYWSGWSTSLTMSPQVTTKSGDSLLTAAIAFPYSSVSLSRPVILGAASTFMPRRR